jgi:hypothetical protein
MTQQFRTNPVAQYQLALYQVSIRDPLNYWADLATYTFPLTPTLLRMERNSLSNFADIQGPPGSDGVMRVMDTYGLAPPMWVIEGTTGWDQHATDGMLLTGLQSIMLLQQFLAKYAQLNQIQRQAGNPNLYQLEFYDYFQQQFWQIEPVGPQGIRMSADRTKLTYYRFRWAGIQPVGIPLTGVADEVLNILGQSAAQTAITTAQTLGATLLSYGPTGVASSIP